MIADGITTAALLVAAPVKAAVLTVTSAAVGTVTDQPVAVFMAVIVVTRLAAVTPDATAVCTAAAVITLVSTSVTNEIVAARRAAAELVTCTPERYETAPVVAVQKVAETILAYEHS